MKNTASEADIVMNTITSSPLYELRLSAIGTIESQASLAWIGMRLLRISMVTGEKAHRSPVPAGYRPASKGRRE